MKKIFLVFYLTLITLFSACNDDDSNETSNEPTLSELRDETMSILTSGTTKTWMIYQAKLTSGGNEIDISQNFNVVDDEFVFTKSGENGNLTWKKGHDIQTNASNSQETLLDKYVSPLSSSFSFQDDSVTIINAGSGQYTFTVNSDNTINAIITNNDNTIFNFVLVEKTQNDYLSPPPNGLNFSTAFTFESDGITSMAPGMVGSYSDNSFFIVTREDGLNNGDASPERIIKFDIETNIVSENLFFNSDYVSKQLHIIDNHLFVIGGQYINQYNLDFTDTPISISHGKQLSRFGISVLNNDIYIIGGDLSEVESEKIFKWDIEAQILSEFTSLPEPKSGARGTIVNDNLYIFGGSEAFYGDTPTNTIYKIDINNPSQIETFQMNKVIDFTFVQKFQNLIYVAGRIEVRDADGTLTGRDATVGVFNTTDNTYQELNTNLVNTSGSDTIHQMCIFNNKMYIIYGNQGIDNGGLFPEWKVLVSELN